MSTEMSAEELAEYLRSGSDLPIPVILTGLVDAGEEGYLSFSPGDACEKWIPLPTSLVLKATPLGVRRCNDHTYNLVRLELKTSDNPEVTALQALLAAARGEVCAPKKQSPRLLSKLKEFQGTTAEALPQVICDTIGDIVLCTDGENLCWWSPRIGYGCN